MNRNGLCAAGLHLSKDFAASADIICRVTIGDSDQNDAHGPPAFLREEKEALPAIALETRKLCSFAGSRRIVERKGKTVPCAFLDDESEHVGIGGALCGKMNLHGNCLSARR
jgi:hypothetical protein